MHEFNWGDPFPLPLDPRKGKLRSDERAAKHYVQKLSEADIRYQRDANGVAEALAMFDREAANVRRWQGWAAERFADDADDTSAAEMCRDFALNGVHLAALRLHS